MVLISKDIIHLIKNSSQKLSFYSHKVASTHLLKPMYLPKQIDMQPTKCLIQVLLYLSFPFHKAIPSSNRTDALLKIAMLTK